MRGGDKKELRVGSWLPSARGFDMRYASMGTHVRAAVRRSDHSPTASPKPVEEVPAIFVVVKSISLLSERASTIYFS
jgi:hypothetical protein